MAAVVMGLFLGVAFGLRCSVFILGPVIAGVVSLLGISGFVGRVSFMLTLLSSAEVWLAVQAGFLVGATAGVIMGKALNRRRAQIFGHIDLLR